MTGVARAERAFVSPLLSFWGPRLIGSRVAVDVHPNQEDGALARRVEAGDERALEEIYEEHGGVVFAFLVSRMGQREAAEDVLQQVFVEVWEKAGKFDPSRGSLVSWVMSIASSRSIDSLRKRVPEPRDPGSLPDAREPSEADGVEDFLADWEFAQIVGRLPEPEAELLRMRFSEDLSQTEISERMGIPLGTVKARMVSGLNTLRREMGVS
ncbi:MAG: sigma-70 family RNA polymerase sigma factor [Solirubrobacterales bacterium]|nr:sigma-70 family RNA polymerase sigma factor [Solirubrobacterales bacterium]